MFNLSLFETIKKLKLFTNQLSKIHGRPTTFATPNNSIQNFRSGGLSLMNDGIVVRCTVTPSKCHCVNSGLSESPDHEKLDINSLLDEIVDQLLFDFE
jgi:hypothetical protein